MNWLVWLWACSTPQVCTENGTVLDVGWQASWRAPTCDPALGAELQATADEVEARLSIYADDSELHRVRDGVGPVPVSEQTYRLVRQALDLADATGGAYDPTVEPLVLAWGFGIRDDPQPPSAEELMAARARVGWEAVQTGREAGAPWVDSGDRALDLTSLLEGQIADALAFSLASRGLGSHLVTVGDESAAGGEGPSGPWRVGPDASPGEPGAEVVVPLSGGGLAVAHGGRHLLDPQTGLLIDSDVVLAVVWSNTATRADGLATAVVASGSERGLALIEAQPEAEALVITSEQTRYTLGFPGL